MNLFGVASMLMAESQQGAPRGLAGGTSRVTD
jgi:hypothetical protein